MSKISWLAGLLSQYFVVIIVITNFLLLSLVLVYYEFCYFIFFIFFFFFFIFLWCRPELLWLGSKILWGQESPPMTIFWVAVTPPNHSICDLFVLLVRYFFYITHLIILRTVWAEHCLYRYITMVIMLLILSFVFPWTRNPYHLRHGPQKTGTLQY